MGFLRRVKTIWAWAWIVGTCLATSRCDPVYAQALSGTDVACRLDGNAGCGNPIHFGTALPATCTVGTLFFDSDATAGSNIYGCTAANTWTLQSGAGIPGAYVNLQGSAPGTPQTGNINVTGAVAGEDLVAGDAVYGPAMAPVFISNVSHGAGTLPAGSYLYYVVGYDWQFENTAVSAVQGPEILAAPGSVSFRLNGLYYGYDLYRSSDAGATWKKNTLYQYYPTYLALTVVDDGSALNWSNTGTNPTTVTDSGTLGFYLDTYGLHTSQAIYLKLTVLGTAEFHDVGDTVTAIQFNTSAAGGAGGGIFTGPLHTPQARAIGATPTVSNTSANSCGTTAATIAGKDDAWVITVGATAGTSCTITFDLAAPTRRICTAQDETAGALATVKYTDTTHSVVSGTFAAADKISGVCRSY
jgi:hypothetical protein